MRAKKLQASKEVKAKKRKEKKEEANLLTQTQDAPQKRAMILSQEKGASHWFTVLPMTEHGFSLHKGAFRDGLCLRYGWKPERMPIACMCGKQFNVKHALSCNRGGFPIIRHNELRNITADMLAKVCHNVSVEPHLQPLNGEEMTHTIREDNARLDMKANWFWGDNFHTTFFDVQVFNPHAPSNKAPPVCTRSTKGKRGEPMIKEFCKSNMAPVHPWSSPPLEEWDEQQQQSTREWLA